MNAFTGSMQGEPARPGTALTCLIVEDSRVIRRVSRHIVESLGMTACEAEDGQQALIACLRRRAPDGSALFLLTRSSAVLDLDAVGRHEAIILCPANHSAPTLVTPHRGAPGYEAVATCLASPEVRARTEGVVAVWRPATAASA